MSAPKIRLLTFDGCPLAAAARRALQQALTELGLSAYDEVDLLDPSTPAELRGWGSPTILVNGRDVCGCSSGDEIGCRVYAEPGGVPSAETVVAAVREHSAG